MDIVIAYGSPGSGKSTLLRAMQYPLLDLDGKYTLNEIKGLTAEFIKLNTDNKIIVDAPFFYKHDIEIFINEIVSELVNISELTIYDFEFNKEAALINEERRIKTKERIESTKQRIKDYKYLQLCDNDLELNVNQIKIIKKETY